MIIKIPADALVIFFGGSASGKSTFGQQHFMESEIVSSDKCRFYVCDSTEEQKYNTEAFSLFHHWVDTRLSIGGLTVADATNLQSHARTLLRQIAEKHNRPVVVIKFKPDLARQLKWNTTRERYVPPHALEKHFNLYIQEEPKLDAEGYTAVYEVDPTTWDNETDVLAVGLPKHVIEAPAFDIIGDIHGCYAELSYLLDDLGYDIVERDNEFVYVHPDGRIPVFVGDLTDRGPNSVPTLRLVSRLVRHGLAKIVRGNHDDKLARYLKGNNVKVSHGIQTTVAELEECSAEEKKELLAFLQSLPYQLHLKVGVGEVIVSHAGIPIKYVARDNVKANKLSLYGPTKGYRENGMSIRDFSWIETWNDTNLTLVTGHTPYKEPQFRGNTVCVDTGCVFGNKLTALRWPEQTFVSVNAEQQYAEVYDWVNVYDQEDRFNEDQ